MELTELIQHPEMMDKETLYDLRSLIALHPYYQTARILMLLNLYLLHDPTFDEELRRAAIYITDRSILFNMFEGPHYQLDKVEEGKQDDEKKDKGAESRTISLIDDFLKSIPNTDEDGPAKKRKPTPADAAIDYVSYLVDIESPEEQETEKEVQLKGQNLIDNFIKNDKGKIKLKENPEFTPAIENETDDDDFGSDEGYFTETLARIYIKQGRYSKALEIIKRLNLNYPKKNIYFADQVRFLEKLILNNKK